MDDLKALFTQVDEVVDCSKIILEELKEEGRALNSHWVTDCHEIMHRDKEQKKAAFERQVAVNEDDERNNLESFNQEVINEIVRLNESTHQNTFGPPFVEDFDSNANGAFEFQEAERQTKNIRVTPQDITRLMQTFPLIFKTS